MQIQVDRLISANYTGNAEVEAKRLLDRNKHLEKKLEQRRKKKWKKFTNRVDYGYFKPRDMTQLQQTGGIIKGLDEEKVEVDVESIQGVGKKRTHAEVLSKVVKNTVGTHSKPKNTDKTKSWNVMFLRPIVVCVGTIKLKVGRIFTLK